ncbi:Uridine-cytidine kinase-like 1 [Triplophysa tibetana]|uniref:Uridine-cytidine kinase-like 1 n=1 Tax=Triplophysa tibetana TaxID=1572043 RepID=A0A5A9NZB3_9TELE|nr:Uridine-cytidine kinase-like 1 [Triplophysa tibetana]
MDDSRQAISRADMSSLPGYTEARVSGCWSLRTDGGTVVAVSTVANKIIEVLDVSWVVLLSTDSFYKLHYLRLPRDISEDHVILMDSNVSTGAAAMMAVRLLLDHDVQEDNILLVSLLMGEL